MDSTIVNKIISGDKKAFEALFNDYYERLAYFAYQYLKDKDNAEDVVQELFSKLWVNRQKLSINTSLNAYLYGATKNSCLNQLKHQEVKAAYSFATATTVEYDGFIPNKVDAEDLGKLIQSCIIDLPRERQKIFLLSREEGLKYKEIAEELDISVKTVEAQMGKALRFLKDKLNDYLIIFIVIFLELMKGF